MNTNCIELLITRVDVVLDNRDTSGGQRKTSLILTKKEGLSCQEEKNPEQYKSLVKFSKKLLPCMLKQIIHVLQANPHTCAHRQSF